MQKITKVEQQKRNKNRYSIYIDDQYAFGVDEDLVVKFNLLKGRVVEEDFIEEIVKAKEQSKANNYAIKLLSYRDRSEKEIYDSMTQKGYDKDITDKTIEFLKNIGYIDDEKFAVTFINDRLKFRKMGPERIKIELYRKGISKEIINDKLKDLNDKEEEYCRAKELASKKVLGTYKNDDYNSKYRKLGSFLQRKGYSYDIISKVLREVLKR